MSTLRIIRNTGWNIVGQGVPVFVALATMPLLIRALGEARFGILALGWLATGYFALFDFGVGRATTRCMSALRVGQPDDHSAAFWSSLHLHAVLGVLGGLVFALAAPWFASSVFAIPLNLREEAANAFLWLAFSVPALVFASAFRGALESEQRFDLVNAVKLPASVVNYLAPLAVIQVTPRIDAIIAVIAVSRWLMTLAYAVLCARAVQLAGSRGFDRAMARHLLRDGGWLTVSSLVAPLIMAVDRLVIASYGSLEAVTHYVVPYEVITKLWILSASLLGAAFPQMSIMSGGDLRRLCDRSLNWLLLFATPSALAAILLGGPLLRIWVGARIADESTLILQILAVGVWLNVLAQVPMTALQATGHSGAVGRLQLIELPLYAVTAWGLVLSYGVAGVAMAWVARSCLDAAILTYLLRRKLPELSSWPWRLKHA